MSSRSLNKVMLIGNLTRDPELRYTPNGTAVCSFRVATNRSWAPSDGGERKEETEFHRIVSWNKLAELCSQLLVKGRKVYVEGRLQTRSWDTPEGEKKYMTEVVAEDMVVLDSRRPEEREEPAASEKEEPAAEKPETKASGVETKKEKEENLSKKSGKEKEKSAEESADKAKEGDESKESKGNKEDADSGEINVDDIPF